MFAIIRIEQLPSWAAVHHVGKHGRREDRWMPHIDAERTPRNRILVGTPDPAADVRALHDEMEARQRRGNASPATHVLLTASPQWFRPSGEKAGDWPDERVEAFVRTARQFAGRWFPGMVAHMRLDLDEETPHIDILVVPVNRRRGRGGAEVVEVSHRTVFSKGMGPRSYGIWQTRWAEACAPLGLERGRARSLAAHERPKRWQTAHYVELLGLRRENADLRRDNARLLELAGRYEEVQDSSSAAERLRTELAAERRRRSEAERERDLLRTVVETLQGTVERLTSRLDRLRRWAARALGERRAERVRDHAISAAVAAMIGCNENSRRRGRRRPQREM